MNVINNRFGIASHVVLYNFMVILAYDVSFEYPRQATDVVLAT